MRISQPLLIAAVLLGSHSAHAYVPIPCDQTCYYNPPRIANAQAGDVIAYKLRSGLPDVVQQTFNQVGLNYEHVAIVSNYYGSTKTQNGLSPGQGFKFNSCGAPINQTWIHNMLPGTQVNMSVADDRQMILLHADGNGYCTGTQKYRIYGLLNDSFQGQCAQFLNDSCSVPSTGITIPGSMVDYAKNVGVSVLYNIALGAVYSNTEGYISNMFWGIGCGGDGATTLAWRAAWQLTNEVIHMGGADQGYQVGGGYNNFNYAAVSSSYTVPAWPDGVVNASGRVPDPANYQAGYYTCYSSGDCSAQQPL